MRYLSTVIISFAFALLVGCSDDSGHGQGQIQGQTQTQGQSQNRGCSGRDYEKTLEIVEEIWTLGYNVGMSNDPIAAMNYMLAEIQRLDQEARELPRACQALIQQWGEALGGGSYGSGGTQCVGGVCCDSTGCY